MKDKKIIPLIILALVFAALLAVYLIMNKGTKESETESDNTETQTISAARVSSGTVIALSYTYNGETVPLVCEDGLWYIEGDKEFPLDSAKVSDMAEKLSSITASRKFERGDTPSSDFGFDEPLCVITAETPDGETVTHTIGKYLSAKSEYYFCYDDETVYTIPQALYTAFSVSKDDLMKTESLTTLDTDSVTFVSVGMTHGEESSVSNSTEAASGVYDIYKALSTEEYTDYKNAAAYGFDGSEYVFTINYTEPIESDGVTVDAAKSIVFSVAEAGGTVYYSLGSAIIYPFGDISALEQLLAFTK